MRWETISESHTTTKDGECKIGQEQLLKQCQQTKQCNLYMKDEMMPKGVEDFYRNGVSVLKSLKCKMWIRK